ncbi:MAG: glycoside hydrolase family 3 N-terminal domain-containing protein [Flavobacteriales bacterium]
MKSLFYISVAAISSFLIGSNPNPEKIEPVNQAESIKPAFLTQSHTWADSVFDTLTEDQRIAQLFMVAAYSNKDTKHEKSIESLISKYNLGGLIFMQGTPEKEIKLTNRYQSKAKTPLMIAIDGEWGLPMRLKKTFKFPKQMTLGAIQHDSLIYDMGKEMAMHCKRIGIHVNFAPVIDVNNNRKNPVINYRSFGEQRENVTRKGIAYMKGMQDNGVLACAKHFPGHGDTDKDSHKALPVITHKMKRLNSVEFYPFKKLINEGIGSMMVAHLFIPALDSTKNRATTLSKRVVTDLLQTEMGFEGLIFTDALNMKGVSSYYKPGVVDVKALIAGNDVLLFSEDVPTAIAQIKKAIKNGEITKERVWKSVKKILYAKEWMKISQEKISSKGLSKDLNPASSDLTNRLLFENALTLVKNEGNLIPLKRLDTTNIASVVIGNKVNNEFQKGLSRYTKVSHYSIFKKASQEKINALLKKLKKFDKVIISVHKTKMNGTYGVYKNDIKIIKSIAKNHQVILNYPTNAYALAKLDSAKNIEAIVVSYEENNYTNDLVGQLIFGGIGAKGKLPVTGSPYFKVGTGIDTKPIRLKYTIPEEVGIASNKMGGIGWIAREAIKDGAFPGCQVLVAKNGKVIYNQNFGHYTYSKKRTVKNNTLYDLASITKVAATTAIVMKMVDNGELDLDKTLGDYLPENVKGTQYKNVKLKDMLTHQARFRPWIPFYIATLDENGDLNKRFYSTKRTSFYTTEVAKNIYIFKNYNKAIIKRIVATDLLKKKKYKYSDIGYYFLKEIIENKTGRSLDYIADSLYYKPMGLQNTLYKPLAKFSKTQITPTELDTVFRNQLIHGYVHDQGAAMLGGVGGHAGLFSNATELATIMQLFLNEGVYGGQRFIGDSTIQYFTSAPFKNTTIKNRRGIGFDKPTLDLKGGPTCDAVSMKSYGHSGFTGTRAWVDPEHELVYIFLSNRVYPDANNWKLVRNDIRTRIEKVIYNSFGSY